MQGLSGWVILAVNLLVVLAVLLAAAHTTARGASAAQLQTPATIENQYLVVRFDAGGGKLRVTSKQAAGPVKQLVLSLAGELPNPGRLAPNIVDRAADELGAARALEFRAEDGSSQTVWLYPDQPFVFSRLTLVNKTSEPKKFSTIVPLSLEIETGAPTDLRWFGSDGPGASGEDKTNYVFLALVDPKTQAGLVSGWITHERASGVVAGVSKTPRLDARSEYGNLTVAPGASVDGERQW